MSIPAIIPSQPPLLWNGEGEQECPLRIPSRKPKLRSLQNINTSSNVPWCKYMRERKYSAWVMPGEVKRRPRYPTFKFPTMDADGGQASRGGREGQWGMWLGKVEEGRAPGMEERLKTSVWSPPPTSPSRLWWAPVDDVGQAGQKCQNSDLWRARKLKQEGENVHENADM